MSEEEGSIGFARRYRPETLTGYIGNESVITTVKGMLEEGKHRPQAILLTGMTGCGKTTLARILVREYLCERRDSAKGACGECDNCSDVAEYVRTGNSEYLPDVTEVDITDKSTKNDINEVLESAEYPAQNGKYKVYILDEVHLATQQSQSRLLKIVEEPPEGVLFILCTTDPQKILDTLKNRCTPKLHIKKPRMAELVALLGTVCMTEAIQYENAGLRILATRANFIIRDALNLLEQVTNSRGNALEKSVVAEFNEISDALIFDFFNAYKNKDYTRYVGLMHEVRKSTDFGQFLNNLRTFTTRGVYILNGTPVEGLTDTEIEKYGKLFKQFTPYEVMNILTSLQRMSDGDVETNLLTFIYAGERLTSEVETPSQVLVPVEDLSVERRERGVALQKKNETALESGREALKSATEEVGIDQILDLFPAAIVDKD